MLLHLGLGVGLHGDARGEVLGLLHPQFVVDPGLCQLLRELSQGGLVRSLEIKILIILLDIYNDDLDLTSAN